MKKALINSSIIIASLSVLLIILLATGFFNRVIDKESVEDTKTRIVTPRETASISSSDQAGWLIREENLSLKMPLADNETEIAVLNRQSETHQMEEQFVVYRTNGAATPISLAFIGYDMVQRGYRRMWNTPTAATRSETISLFTQDLIGDRNNCIIVTGMNANNEQTMTIFRHSQGQSTDMEYKKIAELVIAGSIVIQETGRSLAYQQGITRGKSHTLASYGHDSASLNMLDQIETIYAFNPLSEQYEQINVSRIPGSQIEQRRLRELLSGAPGVFENFISDLWYYVTAQGTIDMTQYLYFNPAGKEIIFYGDEAQQVFRWQTSNPTRFGLFIRSQNISISTLLRSIDIELESLDSIRLRVIEDVRLRITANTTWDGSYRRAGAANVRETVSQLQPTIDAAFDSSWGRIHFNSSGEYTITSSVNTRKGRYVFYKVDNNDLLEMRPEVSDSENRMVYKTEIAAGLMILSRVRVGTNGIQDLLEPPVTFTPVN